MRDEIVLATHGLTRRFGGLVAVNDVDFDVKSNEIHAILGPNGAGKSTLINLLSGEIPPSEGQVLYHGDPIQEKALDTLRVWVSVAAIRRPISSRASTACRTASWPRVFIWVGCLAVGARGSGRGRSVSALLRCWKLAN